MKRLTALATEGRVRRTIVGAFLLAGLALLTQAIPRTSGADPLSGQRGAPIINKIPYVGRLFKNTGVPTLNVTMAGATATVMAQAVLGAAPNGGWADPATTMGAKTCIQCHRSEYLAWLTTKHAKTEATIAEYTGNTATYAEALGIKAEDVLHHSLCANCHATPQKSSEGKIRSIAGVSCESCHGASGGEQGWLNRHAVYGPNVTPIDLETPQHRQARLEYCDNAGMVRAATIYSIAKNCYQCHSVTNEKLVNAGHKAGGGFELVGWSIGEVRHNFHQNQAVNAEGPSLWQYVTGGKTEARKRVKFIVGTLVSMEVSLNALASATEGDTDFTNAHKEQIGLSNEILGGIMEGLEDDAPEELAEAMEILEESEFEDADFGEQEARDNASAAARKIAGIARKIAALDGSKLAGMDEFMNDEVVSVKGKAYSRKP